MGKNVKLTIRLSQEDMTLLKSHTAKTRLSQSAYLRMLADFVGCLVALEDAGIKTVGVTNESTGRDGHGQPLVTLDEKCDAIVSCGNVGELIELPPMETVLGLQKSLMELRK